jgi:colicin import membrane protein
MTDPHEPQAATPLAALAKLDHESLRLDRDDAAHATTVERIAKTATSLQAELAANIAEHKALTLKERETERKLTTMDQSIRHAAVNLEGAKDSAAYAASEREIATRRAERDGAEADGLALLEQLEANAAKKTAIEAKIAHNASAALEAKAIRERALAANAVLRERTDAERSALLAALPAEARNQYLALVDTLGRPVFTSERGGFCSACSAEIDSATMARVSGRLMISGNASSGASGIFTSCAACNRIFLR